MKRLLKILGIAVGFLSGVFGVGGGFLATPFLLFMGIPPAIAVGTQANQLIATSVTGVLGHWRKGNVDPLLGGVMLLGSQIVEEPAPPQIPDELPERAAKEWQMIYSQNLQRVQRRMALWENVGKLLLGYADTSAVLAALPKKAA